MAFMPVPSHGATPGLHYIPLSIFKIWGHILSSWNLSLSAPNFEETLIVTIKRRGKAETVISVVTKMIDSMINYSPFLIAN